MTQLIPRAELAAIPDVAAVVPALGLLNLAGNELATPPPPPVIEAITSAAAAANHYPQIASFDLTLRLSRFHNVNSTQLVVGNGSANVLHQVLLAMCQPSDEIVFATPSFEAYPTLARIVGAVPVSAPLGVEEQPEALLAAIHRQRTRAVIICNPHNPTGALTSTEDLERFLESVPAHILIILDEAYHEFATDPSRPDGIALAASGDWPNLVTTRTLSKAYGLGGARIGYCVARSDIAAAARKCAVPYSVNAFAQAAGVVALDNAQALAPTHHALRHERDTLKNKLVEAGFSVPDSHTNFLWLPLGKQAAAFYEYCRRRKILIRLYPDHGVRVTVGRPEDNEAFLAMARAFANDATTVSTPQ